MRTTALILLSACTMALLAAPVADACGPYGAPPANITGTIESAAPLASYRVTARCGEDTVSTVTDDAGRFALRGRGSCVLTVASRDGARERLIAAMRVTTPALALRLVLASAAS